MIELEWNVIKKGFKSLSLILGVLQEGNPYSGEKTRYKAKGDYRGMTKAQANAIRSIERKSEKHIKKVRSAKSLIKRKLLEMYPDKKTEIHYGQIDLSKAVYGDIFV